MRIHDFEGKYRPLSLPEAFIYSSNISMAKMAMAVGKERHRAFLKQFGQMEALRTELPETAVPILPRRWNDIETATASFGHGIAVTPLQASMGVAALVNGGQLIRPTFLRDAPVAARTLGSGLVTAQTSRAMRYLMSLNAETGSARNARVAGYFIGGKTGTAEKVVAGRYSKTLNVTSFMGTVPADNPRYLLLTLLDEPKGLPETYGFRTSGWNAVPLGGAVFERILPMLGELPSFEARADPFSSFR
jgi:cell division protein FtsI (penicillin-binding protein 3)